MKGIAIELTDRIQGDPCPCCGGRTTRLTRFVHRDGDAHAVYFAAFSDNHSDRLVHALISLGSWGDGSKPSDRVAIAVAIRRFEDQYQVMVVDPTRAAWRDADILGPMLDRKSALKYREIKEIFHITDHIVEQDVDVRKYLNGTHNV